jgi:hypothetical protein
VNLPAFWADADGRVFVQYAGSTDSPHCRRTRLHLDGAEPAPAEASARPIPADRLQGPSGAEPFPFTELSSLRGGARDVLCSALSAVADRWAPAFEGSPADGRQLASLVAGVLGLPFASFVLTERTQLRDVLGDPRNAQTVVSSRLYQLMQNGGVFLVDVPELSPQTARAMTRFAPVLDVAGTMVWIPGLPDFDVDPDFHLMFNLSGAEIGIPSEIAANVQFIWTEPGCAAPVARAAGRVGAIRSGPGKVLVLMKFGVPAYESWFEDVVRPTVETYGECIQLREPMEEWRSEMRFAFERADAVLVDLSYDLAASLSPNVIWELTTIYRAVADERHRREKVLCFARGLEHVKSRGTDDHVVYSTDVDPNWLPPTVSPRGSKSLDVEDVLGLQIRRYDSHNQEDRAEFVAWLSSRLAPWVQGVGAPVTDEELRAQALALANSSGANPFVASWARAIADRDLTACSKLYPSDGACPDLVTELLGSLLASVSAADTFRHRAYWTLAQGVTGRSVTFRTHLLNVLETTHIHQSEPLTNQWRVHAWRCFARVPISRAERSRLRCLASREDDREIKLTIDSVLSGVG